MNKHDDQIDILLRRNVERQLAGFDWEGLRQGIDGRLASAGTPSRSWIRYGRWVALAAAVPLTAGVLLLAVLCVTGPGHKNVAPGGATVAMIETAESMGTAEVSFPPAEKPVRCEITIITSDSPRREDRTRASWCIIARHEPSREEHHHGADASDVLCLF